MGFIKDAVIDASNAVGCSIVQLSREESERVRACVEEKYATGFGGLPLWERLSSDCSRYDPDGWRMIADFSLGNRVTFFFDRESESVMYSVASCGDVVKILSECPGFVFYLTDEDFDFLLCFNDHDYLIGAGSAKDWVKKRE
jgi:hypothetical protein